MQVYSLNLFFQLFFSLATTILFYSVYFQDKKFWLIQSINKTAREDVEVQKGNRQAASTTLHGEKVTAADVNSTTRNDLAWKALLVHLYPCNLEKSQNRGSFPLSFENYGAEVGLFPLGLLLCELHKREVIPTS